MEVVRLLFIWYGDGRNGKSSLYKIMGSCLSRCTHGNSGLYGALSKGIFIKDPRAFRGGKSSHTAHLMPLKGLRMGVTCELAQNEQLDDDMVKQITGGDDISVRGVGKDQETFSVFAKLIIPTNNKPTFDSTMKAIIDRIIYGPFDAHFISPDEDQKLVEPEKHQYAAVPEFAPAIIGDHPMRDAFFTWMVVGAMRYYAEGLKPPQIIKDFKTKSLRESDNFALFLSEEFDLDADRSSYAGMDDESKVKYRKRWSIKLGDIYDMYTAFAEGDDETRMGIVQVSRRLDSMKLIRYRNNRHRMIVGLKVKK